MQTERIQRLARQLYGGEEGMDVSRRIQDLTAAYESRVRRVQTRDLNQEDALLITYPDQVTSADLSPLATLANFAQKHLEGVIRGVHLLPFYPWSSDDGFSVTDFRRVAPRYGTWGDVQLLGRQFDLMFDAEVNHASVQSEWFHLFLKDRRPYRDYFVQVAGRPDLSTVVRPRTTALITRYRSEDGEKGVWTTFGPDQADLNYRSSELLLEMLDVLLFYVSQGAGFIRLDAAAYLWKEIGTTCISLPQTHTILQLMRAVLNEVAPYVKLITETNVPQAENLSYFGDGTNEAQLVYNFALPPLLLHAFCTSQAAKLGAWLSSLGTPPDHATFLNVLATHDGIGLNPARGLLSDCEIQDLVQSCIDHGGLVSHRAEPGGHPAPYELNMNFLDALDATGPNVNAGLSLERFVTAHTIMLSLRGVPAIYFHSLFGSRGWPAGVITTGRARSINREKLRLDRLELELADSGSPRARVFGRLSTLLRLRAQHSAFSPRADQVVQVANGPVLSLLRGTASVGERVLCLYNVSPQDVDYRLADYGLIAGLPDRFADLITGAKVFAGAGGSIHLMPYQALWLRPIDQE